MTITFSRATGRQLAEAGNFNIWHGSKAMGQQILQQLQNRVRRVKVR